MILLIDNFDSFTFNLVHILIRIGGEVLVRRNNEISLSEILTLNPSHIVISPGPGTPEDSGISLSVVRELHARFPILGVCLGHQVLAQVFGAQVLKADQPVHGRISPISHEGMGLFADIPQKISMMRYHSLLVDPKTLGGSLSQTAWTEAGLIMGIKHRNYPHVQGIQFHPESFMSLWGKKLLENFIYHSERFF